MTQAQPEPGTRRLAVIDGVRGVAIVLVVLSHGWQLWPIDWIDAHDWARPVFRSGNSAVTVFLVAAGYLTYVALAGGSARSDEHPGPARMHPEVTFLRRLVRVGPSLWLMLAVIMVVATFDSSDKTSKHDNLVSVAHVVTYTWNWYVQGNLIDSRPDFGHLWYLSVDMQAFVIVSALLFMMRRRPVGVLFVLGGFLLLLTWWRFHVTETEFVFQVLVRTTARMDAFVVGALAGAAVPLLRRQPLDRRWLDLTAWVTLVALVPLFAYCSTDMHFLHWGVTLLELDLAVLVGAVALGALRRPMPLSGNIPVWLGRRSLLIYIWHYPIFVFVERHTRDMSWQARTTIALLATAVIVLVCDRLVERRVSRALADPRWQLLADGVGAYVTKRAASALRPTVRDPVKPDRS